MNPEETTEVQADTEDATTDIDNNNPSATATNGKSSARQSRAEQEDTFPVQGIDYVELYVGNAKQAAHFYRTAMGFNITAYAGPETKMRDRASYVVEQSKIRFVLTAPMLPEGPIAEHVFKHGDGVKDVALRVPDVDYAYHTALERGATGLKEPYWVEGDKGRIRKASIAAAGDLVHTFVDRKEYSGVFAPGYHKREVPGIPT